MKIPKKLAKCFIFYLFFKHWTYFNFTFACNLESWCKHAFRYMLSDICTLYHMTFCYFACVGGGENDESFFFTNKSIGRKLKILSCMDFNFNSFVVFLWAKERVCVGRTFLGEQCKKIDELHFQKIMMIMIKTK